MTAIKKQGKYHNQSFIKMRINGSRAKGMMKDYLAKKDAIPSFKIPRKKIDAKCFNQEDTFVWLGHSTILGHLDDISFIVDPMLAKRASPFKCLGPKRFDGSLTPYTELPNIDIVLITHNHYDHMDKETLLKLNERVKCFYVPLDNAQILINWGIEKEKVIEFDWYEDIIYQGVQFSFCPTQHFSGRGLHDRDQYLWGSWVIKGTRHSLYVSGDSGYNNHFKEISSRYGSFDVACIECGAYNEHWSEIHMMPEESVQAALDLKTQVMLPMHWASFDLSTHTWDEPITRAVNQANKEGLSLTLPMIGEVISFVNPIKSRKWWENFS